MKVTLRKRKQRGFTLIELVVVLLVLAGLAGMLVPVFQNLIVKTHGSTGAGNVAELAKSIQMFEGMNFTNPDNYDSLLVSGGTSALGEEHFTATQLTPEAAEALAEAGISTVYDFNVTADQINTFDPDYAAARSLAVDGGSVLMLNSAGTTALGLPETGRYVVFGIGPQSELIGNTMLEAPVHFSEDGISPANVYSRFVAVYAVGGSLTVDDPATTGVDEGGQLEDISRAKLVSVAGLHNHDGNFELSSLGNHLNEYYEN